MRAFPSPFLCGTLGCWRIITAKAVRIIPVECPLPMLPGESPSLRSEDNHLMMSSMHRGRDIADFITEFVCGDPHSPPAGGDHVIPHCQQGEQCDGPCVGDGVE